MINELELRAEKIIVLCNDILALNNSPNMFVVGIIKREFETIKNSLIKEKKVIVLTKKRDLWAYKTIMDSAIFEYDKHLFDKVYEFQKMCRKLPLRQCIIQHGDFR